MTDRPDPGWVERFEQAGWLERAGLLGGGVVRLAAVAIDRAIDRAAQITVEAQDAFRKELDPNVSDATILDESEEPLRR